MEWLVCATTRSWVKPEKRVKRETQSCLVSGKTDKNNKVNSNNINILRQATSGEATLKNQHKIYDLKSQKDSSTKGSRENPAHKGKGAGNKHKGATPSPPCYPMTLPQWSTCTQSTTERHADFVLPRQLLSQGTKFCPLRLWSWQLSTLLAPECCLITPGVTAVIYYIPFWF